MDALGVLGHRESRATCERHQRDESGYQDAYDRCRSLGNVHDVHPGRSVSFHSRRLASRPDVT